MRWQDERPRASDRASSDLVLEASLAEEPLPDLEQLLIIADAMPVLVAYVDRDERYRFANRAYEDWFGTRRADLVGRTVREVVGDEGYAAVLGHVQAALAGQPCHYEAAVAYRAGGTREIRAHYVPHWRDGAVAGFVALVSDISEERQSERERERLMALEREARTAAEAGRARLALLADASAAFSREMLEPARLLDAITRILTEALGDSCASRILAADGETYERAVFYDRDPEVQARVRAAFASLTIEPQRRFRVESPMLFQKPDLEGFWQTLPAAYRDLSRQFPTLSLMVVPLVARGRNLGVLTLSRREGREVYSDEDLKLVTDLADRAAMSLEVSRLYEIERHAVALRDEFLSVAGHELRTPLAALQLQVQSLLHRTPSKADRLLDRLAKIERHTARLGNLVDELLDVSRINGGRLQLHLCEIDAESLVRDVIERLGPKFQRAGMGIALDLQPGVRGHWDGTRIEQVLSNLLENAVKYGAGEPVEIQVRAAGGRARFSVRDHGIGIRPEDRARVFERFERAVPEQAYAGLGLGLWISRQLVDAHGGCIGFESVPGQGTTFVFELPLEPPAAGAIKEPPSSSP